MKNIINYTLILFSAIALAACTEKIELDLPEGERLLVVEGWISSEELPHSVRLTYTSPYFNSEASPVATGATVYTTDNDGNTLDWVESADQPGYYFYEGAGEEGKSYILHITLNDGTTYESKAEKIVPVPQIFSIFWEELSDEDLSQEDIDEGNRFEVKINTVEPQGVGDYYRWMEFINGEYQDDPFDIYVASDEFADGNPILGLNVTDELYHVNDTVLIVQQRISKDAFDFLSTLQEQTAFVGSPFDGPPAPIVGNIRNLTDPSKNALGFFGAAGSTRASVITGN